MATSGMVTPRPPGSDEPGRPAQLGVLVVEDDPADAELMLRTLSRSGLDVHGEVVDTDQAFRAALRRAPDVVLADYTVPGFGALAALATLAEEDARVPLLVVSGTITEDTAIETLRAGAVDFLLKDRLTRLPPAVRAAVGWHRAARERDDAERRLSALAANLSDLVFSVRLDPLTVDFVSPSVQAFSGFSEAEIRRDPKLFPLFHPDMVRAMATSGLREATFELDHPHGRRLWVDVRGSTISGEGGKVVGFQGVARDVSETRAARELLDRRARQWSVVARLGQDVLDGASFDSVLWRAAEGVTHALGTDMSEVLEAMPGTDTLRLRVSVGWNPELLGDTSLFDGNSQAALSLRTGTPVLFGDVVTENRFTISPSLREHGITCGITTVIRSGAGAPFGIIGTHAASPRAFTVEDVNFVQAVANVLTACLQRTAPAPPPGQEATWEPMIGLPSRDAAVERVSTLLDDPATSSVGVVALNIDEYAGIRDAFGQATADRFLVAVVSRLTGRVDEADMVVSLDRGHLYAVYLPSDSDDGIEFCGRLLDVCEEPIYLSGDELRTTASIGVAFGSAPLPDPDRLFRNADLAMRSAREAGGSRIEVFDEDVHGVTRDQLAHAIDLRRGVESGELRVMYQPVVQLSDRRVVGAEALVRWAHPSRGLLLPGSFLDLAENAGITAEIGQTVLREASSVLSSWSSSATLGSLHVSVNASPRELQVPDFAEQFMRTILAAEVSPSSIWLELTEDALMDDAALPLLHTLKQQGVALAIDDFGTRYSSLIRVRDTAPKFLKIDRSFVGRMMHEQSSAAVVDASVYIASALGARPIAEGVETPDQARALQWMGCELAQGFLFSPPLSTADFEEFVATGSGVAAKVTS